MFDTASKIWKALRVLDVSAMIMIGASAALILRYVGFDRSVAGRSTRAAAIAAWTSRAAPLMSRPRLNCSVIRV